MKTRLAYVAPAFLAGLLLTLGLACSSGKDDATNTFTPGEKDSGTDAGPKPPVTPAKDAGIDARPATAETGTDTGTTPPGAVDDASREANVPLPLEHSWTFDTDHVGWDIGENSAKPDSLGKFPTGTLLADDPLDGMPSPGSLKASIPFVDRNPDGDASYTGNQKVAIAHALETQFKDLTGKTISARFKLDSGLTANPSSPGGAKLYVKSGPDFIYADGGWNNLNSADGWIELTLKVDRPGGYVGTSSSSVYSANDIREIGVEISTGGSAGTGGWVPAVVHLDTVGWR